MKQFNELDEEEYKKGELEYLKHFQIKKEKE